MNTVETPQTQPKKTQPKKITAAELEKLLEQAREESWTAVSFISPRAAGWDDTVWGVTPGPVYVIEALPKDSVRIISGLKKLSSLGLVDLEIGDEGARALASLTALTWLNLWRNKIGDEGARALGSLTALTSLDLSSNQIGDEGARALASLTALTSLNLNDNEIGDEGARALGSLTALTSLNLWNNQIGGEGARALLESWVDRPTAEKLAYLDLRQNGDLSSVMPGETLDTTDAQSILAAYRQALKDPGIPPKPPSEAAAKLEDAPKSTPSAPPPATVPPETIGRPNVRAEEPAETDRLGRQDLVEALAAMFEDPKQLTPVTLALLGDWGAGKSTVMGLLRKRLENGEKEEFRFVDFNAWEYEHTKNMPAALAQATVEGLTDNKGSFEKLWLRIRFAFKQHRGVLLTHIFFFAVATAGCLLLRRNLPGLLPENVPNENAVAQGALWLLGAGGAGVYLGYFVWILRGLRRGYQHPLSVQLRTYLSLPKYGEHLGLIPVLKDHISTLCQIELGTRKHPRKRMVVFVDDLDRCEPASIRKTLDALRLVMSIQQVIILIGVDHRIALNAVAQQYKDLAKGHRTKEDIARDYLGKIIQIPIRLERPSDAELLKFTDQVLFEGVRQARDKPNRPVAASTPRQSKPQAAGDDEQTGSTLAGGAATPDTSQPPKSSAYRWSPGSQGDQKEPGRQPTTRVNLEEVLEDTPEEQEIFKKLLPEYRLDNPRQLIRLLNSYRLLKVFGAQRAQSGETGVPEDPQQLMRMLFWLEKLNQWPSGILQEAPRAIYGRDSVPDSSSDGRASSTSPPEAEKAKALKKIGELSAGVDSVGNLFLTLAEKIKQEFTESEYHQVANFVSMLVLPSSDLEISRLPSTAQDPDSGTSQR